MNVAASTRNFPQEGERGPQRWRWSACDRKADGCAGGKIKNAYILFME
jgi:hypothetical protein